MFFSIPPVLLLSATVSLVSADFDSWFEDFQRTDEIHDRLDELASMSPHAEVMSIGTSVEDREIRAFVLGHGGADRPTIVVLGTQHAREWISPMVTTCLADAFTRGWVDRDPEVTAIVDRVDIAIIPVVNPDGYEYSWDFDRFWRKNRRPGGGVDLNRNWNAMWGTGVGGAPPSSEIYPGSEAFSEPETDAVRGFVEANNVIGFLDYHSPIATILYPFAYTSQPGPEEELEVSLAELMADSITQVHGVPHDTGKPGVGNPSGGLAQDWAHGEQGALAWTVELRGGDFDISANQIIPACEENFAGFVAIADRLADEFGGDPPGGGDTGGADDTGPDSDGGDSAGTSAGSTGGGAGSNSNSGGEPSTEGDSNADSASAAGTTAEPSGGSNGTESPGGNGAGDDDSTDDQGCGCQTQPKGVVWPLGLLVVAGWFRRGRPRGQAVAQPSA